MSINLVKKKNREGNYYVYLVEVYRDGAKVNHRTLKSYGKLDDYEKKEPGWFEKTKVAVKNGEYATQMKKELVLRFNPNQTISSISKNYGWKLLEDVYNELGIESCFKTSGRKKKELNELLKLLIFQRILHPQSKLATVANQKELFGDWQYTENDVYRALDKFEEKSSAIQEKVHTSIATKIGRSAMLVFYDVTNYYFEADIDDDFRKRDPSKEHRPNPIVQMGLFIDSNGIPISFQLFAGNQTDPITYIPAIEQVKKQFGIERLVVVADKAMNSKTNISATLEVGDGWLFSQKHRGRTGAPKEIQEFILDPKNWLFNEKGTFATKSMFRERNLKNGQIVQEKVLVTWNKAYADREKIRRNGAIEYAEKLTDAELFRQTSKKGGKKYLELVAFDKETGEKQPFSPIIRINTDQIAFDEQFDGVNVLVTSELTMSDEEMIEHYGELFRIEDCFKITKTEFKTRPIYVRTKSHIHAHFLTCFLSLVILRILQNATDWQFSSQRLIQALKSAETIEFPQGYQLVQGNEEFVELNKRLNIDWTKQFVELEKVKRYGKGWFNTF